MHFASSMINPQLSAASNLKAVPPSVPVADRNGVRCPAQDHPSMAGILTKLAVSKPQNGGQASLQIQFVDNNTGQQIPNSNTVQLGAPNSTSGLQLASTLDAKIQTAAENALQAYPNSGMVVIKPSTGEILAIATNNKNNPEDGLLGHPRPGLDVQDGHRHRAAARRHEADRLGRLHADRQGGLADLPQRRGPGERLHRREPANAYEMSCNTSFVNATLGHNLSLDTLSKTAHDYYGLNQPWDIGIGAATYGTPGPSRSRQPTAGTSSPPRPSARAGSPCPR